MRQTRIKAGIGVGALSLGVLAGTVPAMAHGAHGGVQGVVTGVSASSLQVQTKTGTVSVNLASTTRVIRLVSGSVTDLTPNARVELHLVKGTTTVDAVTIPLAVKSNQTTKPHPVRTRTASTTRPAHPTHTAAATRAGGTIASVSGHTIVIHTRQGQSVTYTLSSTVKVTKLVAGSTADLAVGQTVSVFTARAANTAAAITILKA